MKTIMYIVYRKEGAQFVKNYKTRSGAQGLADKLNIGEGYVAYTVADDLRFRQELQRHEREIA
jgi:hypothetical protein